MLYIGERSASERRRGPSVRRFPQIDIAVDPLEGTNLCATGAPGAIAVLAASERGGLLHAPDLYMEKLVVPPPSKHVVDLDAPVADNLRAIATSLDRDDRRSRHRGARSAPARAARRRHPRDRRAHPADQRRRPLRGHRGRGGRDRRARGDGHRRRAGRRAHGRRDALPERRDSTRGSWSARRKTRRAARRWASPTRNASTARRTSRPARRSSLPPPASPTDR